MQENSLQKAFKKYKQTQVAQLCKNPAGWRSGEKCIFAHFHQVVKNVMYDLQPEMIHVFWKMPCVHFFENSLILGRRAAGSSIPEK